MVVATGGLAPVIAAGTDLIDVVDGLFPSVREDAGPRGVSPPGPVKRGYFFR